MKCEYCDNEVPVGVTRCPSCGAAVRGFPPALAAMTTSSTVETPSQMSCVEKATTVPSGVEAERKSRIAYVLLGIFLGGFGIHNFYAGRPNRALGQLLTTLLAGWLILPLIAVWVWVLCDVCAITTDGNGVKFQ